MKHNWDLRSWMILLVFLLENALWTVVDGTTVVSIVSPINNRVEAGKSLFIQCQISNLVTTSNRGLAWTKDNELFAWNGQMQGEFSSLGVAISNFTTGSETFYTAYFTMTTIEDGGLYRCVVTEGTVGNFVEVVSDTIFIRVIRPYPVCSTVEEPYLTEGTPITITCEVESILANGYPTLYWKNLKTGNIDFGVPTSDEFTITTELNLVATADLDDTEYECYTTGSVVQTCTVGPIQVLLGNPEIHPKTLTVFEGQSAEFTCTIPSSGSISEWYTIPETHVLRTTVLNQQKTFSIANVYVAEDNGKTVVCKATIGGDVLQDTAVLNVILPTTVKPTTTVMTTTAGRTTRPATTVKKATTEATATSRRDPPEPVPDSTTAVNIPRTETTAGSATRHSETNEIIVTTALRTKEPTNETFSGVILIAVSSAGGGFLIILLIIVIIASVCCCGCCNGDGKDSSDGSGMTTQGTGSSYTSWEQPKKGMIPIDFEMETVNGDGTIRSEKINVSTINGSLRSSGSRLSDTMRALPGGYRGTPRMSVKHLGNFTPNGSLRGDTSFNTPGGSMRSFNSKMSNDNSSSAGNFSEQMTPQMSQHNFNSKIFKEPGNSLFQGPSRRNSQLERPIKDNPVYYPSDTMERFPGTNFEANNNTMSTDSYPSVFDSNPGEVPPVPPIRTDSSIRSSRSSRHSSPSSARFKRQPVHRVPSGEPLPDNKRTPTRKHGVHQLDMGFYAEPIPYNNRPPGWSSPDKSKESPTHTPYHKGKYGDYANADDMMF